MAIELVLSDFLNEEKSYKTKLSEQKIALTLAESELDNNLKKKLLDEKDSLAQANKETIKAEQEKYTLYLSELDQANAVAIELFAKNSKEAVLLAVNEAFAKITSLKFIK